MKTVILITVIESSAVMLAILYLYYKRSQSGKRALVFRRSDVSMTTLSFGRANGEGKKSKSKVDRGKRWVQFTAR